MNTPKIPKIKNNIFNKVIGYFLRGILLVIPFFLTIYIISEVLAKLDSIIMLKIPGLGIAIIIVTITIIGYIGSSFLMKSTMDGIEKFTLKIPLVNIIYSSFKEFTNAVVGNKKKFDSPVLMILTRDPLVYKVGFVTHKNLKSINLTNMVAVYVPSSYTFSGDLYIVKKEDIIPIKIPSTEVMKFSISGGITILSKEKKEKNKE